MSTQAGTILADVLSRIRDPNAFMCSSVTPPTTADGQAFVFAQMTTAQIFVNLAERLVVKLATFTSIANSPLTLISNSIISDMITPLAVYDATNNNTLHGPVDFRVFAENSFTWLTDTGAAFVEWTQLGKDLFIVVPVVSPSPTMSIRYLYVTPTLAASTDLLVVPDDKAIHVSRLTELICRIKTRQLQGFDDRLKSLVNDMGLSIEVGANPATL